MQYQLDLFKSQYLDPIKLKEGKEKCPCCSRAMKAYGYSLTKELANLALKIVDYCSSRQSLYFSPTEVFGDELKANTQFQKLKLFGIIEPTGKAGMWRLTKRGYQFLKGDIVLPRKVWAFANKVILKDDDFVHIGQVEPCWKRESLDWKLDYILQPYNTTLKLN